MPSRDRRPALVTNSDRNSARSLPRPGLVLRKLAAALALLLLGHPETASAWSPRVHVYLAEEVREEAVLSGAVRLDRTDFWSQQVVESGGFGTPALRSDVLEALTAHPAYFRAGAIGPDAYPDILFGQMAIHPEANDLGGTNAWLSHLYGSAKTPPERAFALGFLSHAAGDMFGHTFINSYSGGPWTLSPITNAEKHIVVESYIASHTPAYRGADSLSIDTSAINAFLYTNLVDARRNRDGSINTGVTSGKLWLLTRETAGTTLPGLYTRLRAGLEDRIAGYYDHVAWLKAKIARHKHNCSVWDPGACVKEIYYRAVLKGYQLIIGGVLIQYAEAWSADITRGLRAWPETSTRVARKIFMTPDFRADTDGAGAVLEAYSWDYLCSMSGAPDVGCVAGGVFVDTINAILAPIAPLANAIDDLKRNILDHFVKNATGKTTGQWKALLAGTATNVDIHVARGPGETKASAELDDLMGVSFIEGSSIFDVSKFAPAHNTIAATKLSLLSSSDQWILTLGNAGWRPGNLSYGYLDRYLRTLHDRAPPSYQVMLGYVLSLDGSNQWQPKSTRSGVPLTEDLPASSMLVARDCGIFSRFFMHERGDHHDPAARTWNGSHCGEVVEFHDASTTDRCGGVDVQFSLTEPAGTIGAVVWLTHTSARSVFIAEGATSSPVVPISMLAPAGTPPVSVTIGASHARPVELNTTARWPTTCALLGAECGAYDDGCGGQLQCSSCPPLMVCDTSIPACVNHVPIILTQGVVPAWNAATINWTTDVPASSQVEYSIGGTTLLAGPLTDTLVTSHSISLVGLQPRTTYSYRLISKNPSGTKATSTYWFTTLGPPPTIISTPVATPSWDRATITWTTYDAGDSQVEYGTSSMYGSITALDTPLVWSHSQTLTGLAPSTTYYFRVHSKNSSGAAPAVESSFTTSVKPPTISSVSAAATAWDQAIVTWGTDSPADSQLQYGTTTYCESSTQLDPALVTSHSQGLQGLQPATKYYYRVLSKNGSGSSPAVVGSFTTMARLPVISLVTGVPSSWDRALIKWTTDVPADSQVEFGTDAAYGSSTPLDQAMVTLHSQTIGGLLPSTTYYFRVLSKTGSGSAPRVSGTFTTPVRLPLISNVVGTASSCDRAVVTWKTDVRADSQVRFGTTTTLGASTPLDIRMVFTHSQSIEGLQPSTTYHFQVLSKDGSGSGLPVAASFTTRAAAPPLMSAIQAFRAVGGDVLLSWKTDSAAIGSVDYGPTATYGIGVTEAHSSPSYSHAVTLRGLQDAAAYHYRVRSQGAWGVSTSYDIVLPPLECGPVAGCCGGTVNLCPGETCPVVCPGGSSEF